MRTLAAMPLLIFAPATNPTRYNRAGAKGEQDASTKLNVGWFYRFTTDREAPMELKPHTM